MANIINTMAITFSYFSREECKSLRMVSKKCCAAVNDAGSRKFCQLFKLALQASPSEQTLVGERLLAFARQLSYLKHKLPIEELIGKENDIASQTFSLQDFYEKMRYQYKQLLAITDIPNNPAKSLSDAPRPTILHQEFNALYRRFWGSPINDDDIRRVEGWVSKGVDLRRKDTDGRTVLSIAIQKGANPRLLKPMLSHIDGTMLTSDDVEKLSYDLAEGQYSDPSRSKEIEDIVVRCGLTSELSGWRLYLAIKQHDQATFKQELRQLFHRINDWLYFKNTALLAAIEWNNLDALRTLLELPNLDIHKTCEYELTAVHQAIIRDNSQMLGMLFGHQNAQPNFKDVNSNAPPLCYF